MCRTHSPFAVATHRMVGKVAQASPSVSTLPLSADGKQVWFTLKDTGQTFACQLKSPGELGRTCRTGSSAVQQGALLK